MAGLLGTADSSAQLALAGAAVAGNGKLEEPDHSSANWYFGREEIEKFSPSRLDGIDIKKETYFRKSYCTFLQDLGMRLKVPQVTIATAIVFCHRFFHRQSHKKNDRHMIATICMFLAGKVEETPRPLREVIMFSYEIRFKKDPIAVQRIKQKFVTAIHDGAYFVIDSHKDVYEEQKELVLAGERLVLTTLGFDLNIHHPYKPLVAAIKKFKVAQNTLAQVAWNFVNDGLRTSLCLQFKPHHIAAGAIFLAAKFLKVKLPSDGDKVWWQEFEVTPRQLEEVSNQMLELYEQNKNNGATGSLANDPSPSDVNRLHVTSDAPSGNGHHRQDSPLGGTETTELKVDEACSQREENYVPGRLTSTSPSYNTNLTRAPYSEPLSDRPNDTRLNGKVEPSGRPLPNGKAKVESGAKKETFRANGEKGDVYHEYKEETKVSVVKVETTDEGAAAARERRKETDDWLGKDIVKGKLSVVEKSETAEVKVKTAEIKATAEGEEDLKKDVVSLDDVDKDKIKAALEKRRKSRGRGLDAKPVGVKHEPTNEEELLERELESGVDAAAEARKSSKERRDRKPVKIEHDIAGGKEYPLGEEHVSAKRSRKEEGELRGANIDHEVVVVKDRVAEGDLAASNKRKIVKEKEGYQHERKQGKSLERGDHVEGEKEHRVQKERSIDRVEEGEVPSTSGTARSPRSAERRPHTEPRTVSPGGQKRHYNNREQYTNRKDVHKDQWHASHNRDHYHHHSSSSHHRYDQHRLDGERDRHRGDHKDRDWNDRDHKKARHE